MRLPSNVIVRDPHGAAVVIKAGSDLPEWAPAYLRASTVEEPPLGEQPPVTPSTAPAVDGPHGPPPQKGRGSSQPAWLDYARAHGVQVDDDAKREDIIAACAAADVPVE